MQQRHLLSLRNPSVSDPIQSPSQIIDHPQAQNTQSAVTRAACVPPNLFTMDAIGTYRVHTNLFVVGLCATAPRELIHAVTAQLCDLRHGAASKQPLLETSHAIVCPLRGVQQCEQPQRSTFVTIRGYIDLTASTSAHSSSIQLTVYSLSAQPQ